MDVPVTLALVDHHAVQPDPAAVVMLKLYRHLHVLGRNELGQGVGNRGTAEAERPSKIDELEPIDLLVVKRVIRGSDFEFVLEARVTDELVPDGTDNGERCFHEINGDEFWMNDS